MGKEMMFPAGDAFGVLRAPETSADHKIADIFFPELRSLSAQVARRVSIQSPIAVLYSFDFVICKVQSIALYMIFKLPSCDLAIFHSRLGLAWLGLACCFHAHSPAPHKFPPVPHACEFLLLAII